MMPKLSESEAHDTSIMQTRHVTLTRNNPRTGPASFRMNRILHKLPQGSKSDLHTHEA